MNVYGSVYVNCPFSGEALWQDHCSFERFVSHYSRLGDKGRFLFVVG
jgi:hypothetical protein